MEGTGYGNGRNQKEPRGEASVLGAVVWRCRLGGGEKPVRWVSAQ